MSPPDRTRPRPVERPEPTPIAWRLWIGALVFLAAAAFAVTYFVGAFLRDRPFAHHDDALDGGFDEDAGFALVSLSSLTRELDASVATDASVDGGADAGNLSIIDGPAPGDAWSRRTRNFLVAGIDRRPWGRGGGLADTLIVVAIDRRSGHVGLISVPRDYYVEFRPAEFGRINTAFHYARENDMSRGEYLAHVVGTLLDIPIHETIIVDMTVLETAVDAVSGVEVDVPCPIVDNFVDPRTPTGRRLLDVPAGRVHMDGVTAAMYSRSRHGRSDWDRARRQQAIVLALRRRVTSVDALPLIPRLLEELGDHIETEMTGRELLELARFGLRIEPGNMHGMVLASAASEHFHTPEGSSVLIPNVEAIRAQIVRLFDAPSPGVDPHGSRCVEADAALLGRTVRPESDGGIRPRGPARDAGAATAPAGPAVSVP